MYSAVVIPTCHTFVSALPHKIWPFIYTAWCSANSQRSVTMLICMHYWQLYCYAFTSHCVRKGVSVSYCC